MALKEYIRFSLGRKGSMEPEAVLSQQWGGSGRPGRGSSIRSGGGPRKWDAVDGI